MCCYSCRRCWLLIQQSGSRRIRRYRTRTSTKIHFLVWSLYNHCTVLSVCLSVCERKTNKDASYPDWRRSPHTDHHEMQIVYNIGRHRASGSLFLTPHTVHDGAASLLHRASDRRMCYLFFNFWPWGLTPRAKGHQEGRWRTIHLDLPSYKISARSRKRSTRYALPIFFTFWPLGG